MNEIEPSRNTGNFAQHFAPLAEVRRAGVTESVHFGAVAVVTTDGRLVYSAGNPDFLTFARSSSKPFQATPLLKTLQLRREKSITQTDPLNLNHDELALLCASHNGEARHAAACDTILAKAGLTASRLRCGCHTPYYFSFFNRHTTQENWAAQYNNCSGKHAGMLAHCALHGNMNDMSAEESLNEYLSPAHPLQAEIKTAVAHWAGLRSDQLIEGIDGCSAPTFAMPLARLAQAFAALANPATDSRYGDAMPRLFDAMTQSPAMVSGEGRNDLAFMLAGRGDWACKFGAEAVQGIGIRSLGLGIAIKIADGNMRGLFPAAVAVLEQLGVMNDAARAELMAWRQPAINSVAGAPVGDVLPAVTLLAH